MNKKEIVVPLNYNLSQAYENRGRQNLLETKGRRGRTFLKQPRSYQLGTDYFR